MKGYPATTLYLVGMTVVACLGLLITAPQVALLAFLVGVTSYVAGSRLHGSVKKR